MGISPEAQQFAQFLGSMSMKAATPGLDLAIVRDIVETNHRVDRARGGHLRRGGRGRRPQHLVHPPRTPTPAGRCSTPTSGGRSPPRRTRTARPPATSRRRQEPARSSWISA
jgi:hypothetical protein